MLKGTGFTDEDLAKPIIGVATTWIETMPCNLNQRELAQDVKRGIREAGGTPMEFNTIAISDGVSMGTEGMRASLVSREVIADSIELVSRGHLFDGLVCLVACDKTNPAAVMALGRLDIPSVVLYTGSIAPGVFRGKDVTVADVYEAIGGYAAGTVSAEDLHELESVACPGAGACGGQFTANTMSTILEFLGISPPGLNGIPALSPKKAEAAAECGRLAVDLVRRDLRPSHFVTREAIENAAASVVATGGSTNGLLHLLAIAREFGIDFTIDDFDRIAGRTPVLADMKPWGRFHATDVYRAGGVALVARELAKQGLVHGEHADGRRAHARRGRDRGRGDARAGGRRDDRAADQGERLAPDPERQPRPGGLRGQADRRPHAAPRPGARLRQRARRVRGGEGEGDQGGRRGRDPLRGAGRRARDAGDAPGDRGADRRGARRLGRARHRRALLRRDPRVHGRPRRSRRRSAAARSPRSRRATRS